MQIGVITEIKDQEHRVALTPTGAAALSQAGHTVLVQAGAGCGAGFADAHYRDVGARIVAVAQAWEADLVLKVKEPLAAEYPYLREQILFTYLHLAGVSQALTEALLRQKTTAVAYETVRRYPGSATAPGAHERDCREYGDYHRELLSGSLQPRERRAARERAGHTLRHCRDPG